MTLNQMLPTEELVYGQLVALARFFQAQETAADRGHEYRLASYYPSASCPEAVDPLASKETHPAR